MIRTKFSLLDDYLAALNAHDVPRVLNFFSEDCIFEDMVFADSFAGHVALSEFLENCFRSYPDVRFERRSAYDGFNCVNWEWTMRGHYMRIGKTGLHANGQAVVLQGASFTEFDDGLIVHKRDYWNLGAAMNQLGMHFVPARRVL